MQRSNTSIVVDVRNVDIVDVHHAEAAPVSTPPRMEPVTWSERKPTETTPPAETDAKTKTAAPAPERDVRRRPQWVIASPYRSRPPRP